MTTQTAFSIISEAYAAAPDSAEWTSDHDGNEILTIGNRRFVLGAQDEEWSWTEYEAVVEDDDRIVDWDVVASDGCAVEDADWPALASVALAFASVAPAA